MAKALGLLDGEQELLFELVVALVGREIEPVEAGVRARQPGLFAHFFYAELLRPCASDQSCEAADWQTTRAGHELQQARPLLTALT